MEIGYFENDIKKGSKQAMFSTNIFVDEIVWKVLEFLPIIGGGKFFENKLLCELPEMKYL